jgi:hypothetical protein
MNFWLKHTRPKSHQPIPPSPPPIRSDVIVPDLAVLVHLLPVLRSLCDAGRCVVVAPAAAVEAARELWSGAWYGHWKGMVRAGAAGVLATGHCDGFFQADPRVAALGQRCVLHGRRGWNGYGNVNCFFRFLKKKFKKKKTCSPPAAARSVKSPCTQRSRGAWRRPGSPTTSRARRRCRRRCTTSSRVAAPRARCAPATLLSIRRCHHLLHHHRAPASPVRPTPSRSSGYVCSSGTTTQSSNVILCSALWNIVPGPRPRGTRPCR